jgi:hypothetical protein
MPAVSRAINILTRTIQARQTFTFTNPSFPPFRKPEVDDDDDLSPFRLDFDDVDDDKNKLSAGTIAAIVISIVIFFIVVTGLIVFLTHRRRKARKDIEMIPMKKESVSATAVTASGALDPPPPYVESHLDSPHSAQERRESRSDFSEIEVLEDSDAIGSHATITDGPAPGKHTGLETHDGTETEVGSETHTSSGTHISSDIYRGPGSI